MKWTRYLLILAVLSVSSAVTSNAEEVVEASRTAFGDVRGVAVNPTDSSVWVAAGGSIMHLAADGSIIDQFDGFTAPGATGGIVPAGSIAVNATDGSCWFGDYYDPIAYPETPSELVHLAADGTQLLRLGFPDRFVVSVSVNSTDGSCWMGTFSWSGGQVIHMAGEGTELLRVTVTGTSALVSVDPTDGSCWVGVGTVITHLAEDGTVLSQTDLYVDVGALSVNPLDGSCWVGGDNTVVHLGADGAELWRGGFPGGNWVTSASQTDGSCWFAGGDQLSSCVLHLAADGTELARVTDLPLWCSTGAADPADGSFWISSGGTEGVLIHLAPDGTALWQGGYSYWFAFTASTPDGSCWAASQGMAVVHTATDGTELWSGTPLPTIYRLSADSEDGSCWVAGADNWDGDNPRIVHLAEDGTELLRRQMQEVPYSYVFRTIAANSSDGSCWLTAAPKDGTHGSLIHLAPDGSEVVHLDFMSDTRDISVNPADDSVWLVTWDQLLHLSEDGTQLLRIAAVGVGQPSVVAGDGSCWYAASSYLYHVAANGAQLARVAAPPWPVISANGADGSCWVSSPAELIHLAANGAELWRGSPIGPDWVGYGTIDVNSNDGSAWVHLNNGQLAHLVIPGWRVPRFYDVPSYFWAFEQVEACADAGIVMGYTDGLYHPEYTVDRGTMAVYISRALAGGDSNIPDGPPTPSFSDVPTNFWAYKHIEYAVSQNVVKGYTDGTYLPTVTVDRGTMAVYVARAMVAPGGDAAIPGGPATATFADVPTDFWAYKQVEYCVSEGVVKGYTDGKYHPEYPVTRDQMAVYIARAFGLL
ncbi:MAG: S-layer homology domain-containing protein [Armatimonadota bacterium]